MWTSNSREFCKNFGLKYPIIQAPMAGGPSSVELVSAVSSAGGLGSIGAGYLSSDKLEQDLKALNVKNYSVNVFIPPKEIKNKFISSKLAEQIKLLAKDLNLESYNFEVGYQDNFKKQLEIIIANKVPILSFAFGVLSNEDVLRLKENAIKIIGTATNVEEAVILEKAGCDAIVVQGYEAGGHRGGFLDSKHQGVGLIALLPQVLDAVAIPCIAAGGIMDGRAIAAALIMGASAVQMGTAFLSTKESGATKEWKESLLKSKDTDTVQTRLFSGKLARGLNNKYLSSLSAYENDVADYPIQNEITKVLRAKAKELSNPDFQSLWAGQGSAKCLDISADDLIAKLVEQTEEIFKDNYCLYGDGSVCP